MAALGVDISSFEQETTHVSLPGRFNLVGQQVSNRRVIADQQCDAAWKAYSQAINEREDGKVSSDTVAAFKRVYDIAEAGREFVLASERYVESVNRLLNGEITPEQQQAFWNDYLAAGIAFRGI